MGVLLEALWASLTIFREAAFYVLLGFFVAGLIRAYLEPDMVARYFQRGRFRSVFLASLLGIPIPL